MSMILTLTYRIHSYESDFTGRARVATILNYLQESAWNHAEELGVGYSHLLQKNLAWVLARLRLKLFFLPRWGESVTLETWPSGADRLFCFRDFRVTDQNSRILSLATTSWLAVDLEHKRPQKTETYIDLPTADAERVFAEFAGKVAVPEGEVEKSTFRVLYSHLDVNGHMNNVKYVEAAIDALPQDFVRRHALDELTINFVNEAFLGDEIDVLTAAPSDDQRVQQMKRCSDGAEICRLHSVWRPFEE